jgi:short subunit dehydrogenase-like uncharacterized protein
MPPTFLIYGANGYTGALVARHALERGLRPILAGRSATDVIVEAEGLRLPHRIFPLDDPAALDAGLEGIAAVLHCAGPFVHTWRPMFEACLRCRVHYVDVTGEIAVFEALAARNAEARAAGIMALPGAGFDVVPTDCLAAHLKRRLPAATHLVLAFRALSGVSRGTAATAIEAMASGEMGMVRRAGRLTPVPPAWKTRQVDFGAGPRLAVTLPWGDVATAWHSTGIPNVEVYMAARPNMVRAMRLGRVIGPLLRLPFAKDFLKYRVHARSSGPADARRRAGRSVVWGLASTGAPDDRHNPPAGQVAARLEGPEGYTLTALASVAIVEKILAGNFEPGFQTPSLAYGPDFVLELPGVTRTDL